MSGKNKKFNCSYISFDYIIGQVISWVSVLFVVVSTVAMVIGTLPALQGPPDDTGRPTDNEAISMVETICITWFTLEYILR